MSEHHDLEVQERLDKHPDLSTTQVANFRNKLRILRKQQKITQFELADRMQLLHQDVSSLERGKKKVTWEIIEAASRVFNVPTRELLKSAGPGLDSKTYCLRLLDISQMIYNTHLDDYDRAIVEKAIGMLESVIYA